MIVAERRADHSRRLEFFVAFLLVLLLYLPFRSLQWDGNGVFEAMAVDSGGPALVSPNHMLYRPIGYVLLSMARSIGFSGYSIEVLQFLTAVGSALGIGAFFLALREWQVRRIAGFLATALVATSWAHWRFSTDAFYITLSAAAAATALAMVNGRHALSTRRIAALAVWVSAAILFWQANVFLVAPFAVFLIWNKPDNGAPAIRNAALFVALTASLVTLVYLAVGWFVVGNATPPEFTVWLLSHSSGGSIPIWGKWSLDRIPALAGSAVSSIIPIWEGLGLRDLLRGSIRPEKILALLSAAALGVLAVVSLGLLRGRSIDWRTERGWFICLTVGYLAYVPFLIWWDPFEPKWLVVPNLFLGALLARIWNQSQSRIYLAVVTACVGVIAAANFAFTILPRATTTGPAIALAECIASHAAASDYLVVTDWNWHLNVRYRFKFAGEYVYLLGDTENTQDKLARIREAVERAQQLRNGRVFVHDLRTASTEQLELVRTLSGLSATDLDVFEQRPAFRCGDMAFSELLDWRP